MPCMKIWRNGEKSVANFLLITPDDIGVPRALSPIAQGLINRCPSKHSQTSLHGPSVTRSSVEGQLSSQEVVVYFGHGLRDSLGSPGLPLIDSANDHRIQSTLIAIACYSGAGLGPNLVAASASRTFLGFDTILNHPARAFSRANDAYEQALSGLFSTATVGAVAADLRKNLLQAATYYLTNRGMLKLSRGDAIIIHNGLRSNVLAVVCLGDTQKSF